MLVSMPVFYLSLKKIIFLRCFLLCIRFSVFTHIASAQILEVKNHCVSSTTEDRNLQSMEVLFYNKQFCKKYEDGSSCDVISSPTLSKIELNVLQIQQVENSSWLQFSVTPFSSRNVNVVIDPDSVFILKFLFEVRDFFYCYEFWIPSLMPQEPFNLPCIRAEAALSTNFSYMFSSFYKDGTESNEEIISRQEGNYDLLETSEVQAFKFWNLDLDYYCDHLKFYVTFKSPINMTCDISYYVSIHQSIRNVCNVKEIPVYQWIGSTHSEPYIMINCSKRVFEYFKKYCISISVKPDNMCNERNIVHEETIFFQNIPEEYFFTEKKIPDFICRNWNVSFLLKQDSEKKGLTVSLRLCRGMDKLSRCFDFYMLYLYIPKKRLIYSATELTIPYNLTITKVFRNLSNDDYCVLLVPCTMYNQRTLCHENWTLHSNTISITELNQVPISKLNSSKEIKTVVTVVLSCVFGVVVMITLALFLYAKHKNNSIKLAILKQQNQSAEEIHQLLPVVMKSIEIFILYYHDPTTKIKTEVLRDFFQDSDSFHVTLLDDDVHRIILNPSLYLNEMLQYKCSKLGDDSDSNKRFIFIETEEATQYFEYQIKKLKLLSEGGFQSSGAYDFSTAGTDYELERSWFCQAVNILDPQKCLEDYCHLFVVRFGEEFNSSTILPITKYSRYHLPRDLEQLCFDLGYADENCTNAVKEALSRRIENHLIKGLDKM